MKNLKNTLNVNAPVTVLAGEGDPSLGIYICMD